MAFPAPQVGLVISYSYLWSDEAEAGQVEGQKNRPCAIVLAVQRSADQAPVVAVVPITHSPHANVDAAMEIPPSVKRHLGLDTASFWVVLDELNLFTWPGFDLRPVPGHPERYPYGFLPPKLFAAIVARLTELRRRGRIAHTPRD